MNQLPNDNLPIHVHSEKIDHVTSVFLLSRGAGHLDSFVEDNRFKPSCNLDFDAIDQESIPSREHRLHHRPSYVVLPVDWALALSPRSNLRVICISIDVLIRERHQHTHNALMCCVEQASFHASTDLTFVCSTDEGANNSACSIQASR